MFISRKVPIFRIFYAIDWNDPEQIVLQNNLSILAFKNRQLFPQMRKNCVNRSFPKSKSTHLQRLEHLGATDYISYS